MNAQPALKLNELLDRLSIIAKQKPPEELALRRIEAEANQLMKVDAHGAYIALGVASSIKGDIESTRRHHEASLRISDDPTTRENYAYSLAHLGLYQEATTQFDLTIRQAHSPTLLRTASNIAIRAGHYEKATRYLQLLVKIQPDAIQDKTVETTMHTATLLQETGLTETEIAEMNEIALSVATDAHVDIIQSHLWKDIWYEPFTVFNNLMIKHGDASELGFELATRMADINPSGLSKGTYHISFYEASA